MATKQQREERLRTLLTFGRLTTNCTIKDDLTLMKLSGILDTLRRHESALHRLAERECNFGLTDKEQHREESIERKVCAIADELGFRVTFNGDPRGGAIRFILPNRESNSWDGETWGIYW